MDGDLDETGGENAEQDLPLPTQHDFAPEFFNGENHACERGVERGGKPACRACGDKVVFLHAAECEAVFFAPCAPRAHDCRADLDGRSFTPDGRACAHGEEGQRDFEEGFTQADQAGFVGAVGQGEAGEHLRDATAGGVGGETAGNPDDERQPEGQGDPGKPRIFAHQLGVHFQREIRHPGKQEGSQRDQRRTCQQEQKSNAFTRNAAGLADFVRDVVGGRFGRHGMRKCGKGRLKRVIAEGGLSMCQDSLKRKTVKMPKRCRHPSK